MRASESVDSLRNSHFALVAATTGQSLHVEFELFPIFGVSLWRPKKNVRFLPDHVLRSARLVSLLPLSRLETLAAQSVVPASDLMRTCSGWQLVSAFGGK